VKRELNNTAEVGTRQALTEDLQGMAIWHWKSLLKKSSLVFVN